MSFLNGEKMDQARLRRFASSIPVSYTVYYDAPALLYRAECCVAGGTDYSSAVATTSVLSAINGLTGGRTNWERVVLKGIQRWNAKVTLPDYTLLDATQANIIQEVDTNSTLLENSDIVGGNSCIGVVGGRWDGNVANNSTYDGSQALIHFKRINNTLLMRDVYVTDCKNRGILIEGAGGGYNYDVNLDNVHVNHCATGATVGVDDAIGLAIDTSLGVMGSNLRVTNCHGMFALVIASVYGGTFNNIITRNNARIGTEIAYANRGVAINSLSSYDDKEGLYIKKASNLTVNGYNFYSTIADNVGILGDSITDPKTDIVINGFVIDGGGVVSRAISWVDDNTNRIIFSHGKIRNMDNQGAVLFYKDTASGTDLTLDDLEIFTANASANVNSYLISSSMARTRILNCKLNPVNTMVYGIKLITDAINSELHNNSILGTYSDSVLLEDEIAGHKYDVIIAPFVNGTTTDDTGFLLDHAGDIARTYFALPLGLRQIVGIKVFGQSAGAETHSMRLQIYVNGGADNEPASTNEVDVTDNVSISTDFANGDVIYWRITSPGLKTFQGGDICRLKAIYEDAGGADCASNVYIRSIEVQYV